MSSYWMELLGDKNPIDPDQNVSWSTRLQMSGFQTFSRMENSENDNIYKSHWDELEEICGSRMGLGEKKLHFYSICL